MSKPYRKTQTIHRYRCPLCGLEAERFSGRTRCNNVVASRHGRIVCAGPLIDLGVIRVEEIEGPPQPEHYLKAHDTPVRKIVERTARRACWGDHG